MNSLIKFSSRNLRYQFLNANLTRTLQNSKRGLKHNFDDIKIVNKETSIEIVFAKNDAKTLSFNPHWLRFNCQSEKSRQPSTGQRTIDVDSVPSNLTIKSVERLNEDLRIKWAESSNQNDSIISIDFLVKNHPSLDKCSSGVEAKKYEPCHKLEFFNYLDLVDENGNKKDEKIYEWLRQLGEFGLCIVRNLPTEINMVKKLAELIAPVQRTIYDEIFDVKVDKTPINIAYSNVPLEFHMDLMYYESPPGLQFLHCLKFDSEIVGGESLFVDSFEIAENFRKSNPRLFDVLTKIPATFQKLHIERTRPVCMVYQRPHIVLNHRNRIISVNWAPPFEGPLSKLTEEEVKSYYEAYLEFSKAINKNSNIIEYKLRPGEVACFNNRRILHARKGFVQNSGIRHFQGCYLNIDEFKSEILAKEYYLKNKSNLNANRKQIDTTELKSRELLVGNHDFN